MITPFNFYYNRQHDFVLQDLFLQISLATGTNHEENTGNKVTGLSGLIPQKLVSWES